MKYLNQKEYFQNTEYEILFSNQVFKKKTKYEIFYSNKVVSSFKVFHKLVFKYSI